MGYLDFEWQKTGQVIKITWKSLGEATVLHTFSHQKMQSIIMYILMEPLPRFRTLEK